MGCFSWRKTKKIVPTGGGNASDNTGNNSNKDNDNDDVDVDSISSIQHGVLVRTNTRRLSRHRRSNSSSMHLLPEHLLNQYATDNRSSSSDKVNKLGFNISVYDKFLDVVVITDMDKVIQYANGMVEHTLHQEAKNVIGNKLNTLFLKEDTVKIDTLYDKNTNLQEINFRTFIRVDQGIRKLWVNVHMVVQGGFIHVFIRDVGTEMHLQKILNSKTTENQNLLSIMNKVFPDYILEKVLNNETQFLFDHDDIIIGFFDIVGYTEQCTYNNDMFTILRNLYYEIDKMCKKHNLYRIEIIGDAVVVAGNMFPNKQNKVEDCLDFMLDCIKYVIEIGLNIRCGIAQGRAKSGIVGNDQIRYHIFGDVMNTASRMESAARINSIKVTKRVYDNMDPGTKGKYHIIEEKEEMIKGKWRMKTWSILPKNKKMLSHKRTSSVPVINILGGGVGSKNPSRRPSIEL